MKVFQIKIPQHINHRIKLFEVDDNASDDQISDRAEEIVNEELIKGNEWDENHDPKDTLPHKIRVYEWNSYTAKRVRGGIKFYLTLECISRHAFRPLPKEFYFYESTLRTFEIEHKPV